MSTRAAPAITHVQGVLAGLDKLRQIILDLSFRINPGDTQSGTLLGEAYSHYEAQNSVATKLLEELKAHSGDFSKDEEAFSKRLFEVGDKYKVLKSTVDLLERRAPATSRTVWLRTNMPPKDDQRSSSAETSVAKPRNLKRASEGRPRHRRQVSIEVEQPRIHTKNKGSTSSPSTPRGGVDQSSRAVDLSAVPGEVARMLLPALDRTDSDDTSSSGSGNLSGRRGSTESEHIAPRRRTPSNPPVIIHPTVTPSEPSKHSSQSDKSPREPLKLNIRAAQNIRDEPQLRPKLQLVRVPSMSLESLMDEVIQDHQQKIQEEAKNPRLIDAIAFEKKDKKEHRSHKREKDKDKKHVSKDRSSKGSSEEEKDKQKVHRRSSERSKKLGSIGSDVATAPTGPSSSVGVTFNDEVAVSVISAHTQYQKAKRTSSSSSSAENAHHQHGGTQDSVMVSYLRGEVSSLKDTVSTLKDEIAALKAQLAEKDGIIAAMKKRSEQLVISESMHLANDISELTAQLQSKAADTAKRTEPIKGPSVRRAIEDLERMIQKNN